MKVFIALLCLFAATLAHANTPEEAQKIANTGASGLALSLIDRKQPEYNRNASSWLRFERVRLNVMEVSGRYHEIIQRTQSLPANVPVGFISEAQLIRAQAFLALNQADAALSLAQSFLWSKATRAASDQLRDWRRLIIQIYLQQNRLNDARIALRRFYQDYGAGDASDQLLRARVMLRAKEYKGVPRVLASVNTAEAMALSSYAQVQSGIEAPRTIWNAMVTASKEKKLKPIDRYRYWVVSAAAAVKADDALRESWFIEKALLEKERLDKVDVLFDLDGERLWLAYEQAGLRLGNAENLLLGDDAAWMNAAQQREAKKALEARALYAALIKNSVTPASRQQAYRYFMANVLNEEDGLVLLARLFINEKRFKNYADVLPEIRHALVEYALVNGLFVEASRLMDGLNTVPPNIDPFSWYLRQARVHVLGGKEDAGIDVLYRLLAGMPRMDREHADQFLQVVFDLQTVKRHQDAINLFVAVQPRLTDKEQQREVLFWQADSYKAVGLYDLAAWLYLKSAILHNPNAYDPWAQTARFHAAEALTEAHLIDDARFVYENLLSVTPEKDRRAVLKRKLQELRLLE